MIPYNLLKNGVKNLPNIKSYAIAPNTSLVLDVVGFKKQRDCLNECNSYSIQHYKKEIVNFPKFELECDELEKKYDNIIDLNKSNVIKLTVPQSDIINPDEWSNLHKCELFEIGRKDIEKEGTLLLKLYWNDDNFRKYCDSFSCNNHENQHNPDWIYTYSGTIPNSLLSVTESWKYITKCHNYNFHSLFITAPYNLLNYNRADDSLMYSMLLRKINGNIKAINYLINDARVEIKNLLKRDALQANINKYGSTKDYLKSNDISSIYVDEYSGTCLSSMINVINDIPGAQKWLLEEYDSIYSDNKTLKKIMSHPKTDKLGHSGGSAMWTLGTAKKYFELGPETFVRNYLLDNDYPVPSV